MHVRLGALVLDKYAIDVGHVDRLIIDPRSRQIVQLVAKQGRLKRKEVIIDRSMANHVDTEGRVHLGITEQEVDRLREFYSVDYTPPNHAEEFSWVGAVAMPLGGPRTTITNSSTQYSTLPEDVRVVKKGMEVKGQDFETIGEIHDVEFDNDVAVTGFTVLTGGRRHHEQRSFPVTQVAGVGVDYIRLNISAAEALAMTLDPHG